MAVRGVFTSDSNIPSSRKGDFASALLMTNPTGSAPMLALSAGMARENATDSIITWFEDSHLAFRATTNHGGGYNSSDVSVVVDDGSYIVAKAVLFVEATGELLYVSAVSGNTLTVTRGFAGSTADVLADDGGLQLIGVAHEEGSAMPTAIGQTGLPLYNLTQIFRNSWGVSRTARQIAYYTGNPAARNKANAGLYHAELIERSLIWSKLSNQLVSGNPQRTMNGILAMLSTNVTAAGSTTKMSAINAFLLGIFAHNIKGMPNERIAFCGNAVITVINRLAQINTTTQISVGQTDFGLAVTKWISPYGTISLMTHPLFNENPTFTKNLLVLHPGAMKMRWLSPTEHEGLDAEGRRAGVDADNGVFTSELSMEYASESTGGYMTGFTAALAES